MRSRHSSGMSSTAEHAIAPSLPRSRTIVLWILIGLAIVAAVLTMGGLGMTAAALLVIVFTWSATDLARGAGTPRQLVGPLLVSGGILLLGNSFILFMLAGRETSRTPVDEIGYRLFWPGGIALGAGLLSLPIARTTSWARFARGFTWAATIVVCAALLLEQLAGIGL